MDKFVCEVEHAYIQDFCKVLPDGVDDSPKEGRTVDVARNVH